jgi:hypothetical protein
MATNIERTLAEMEREIERQDAELEAARANLDGLGFVPSTLARAHLRALEEACDETMVVRPPPVPMPFAIRV